VVSCLSDKFQQLLRTQGPTHSHHSCSPPRESLDAYGIGDHGFSRPCYSPKYAQSSNQTLDCRQRIHWKFIISPQQRSPASVLSSPPLGMPAASLQTMDSTWWSSGGSQFCNRSQADPFCSSVHVLLHQQQEFLTASGIPWLLTNPLRVSLDHREYVSSENNGIHHQHEVLHSKQHHERHDGGG
jgi:hypothetical protein